MRTLELIREKLNLLTHDPICDIEESKSHKILSFDLPNMSPEDFDVYTNGKRLIVAVKREHTCSPTAPDTKIISCHHHNFLKEFEFPIHLSADKIDAFYDNGVLRIAVPKNALLKKQKVIVSDMPDGFFRSPSITSTQEPIEVYSDIDDYDWE